MHDASQYGAFKDLVDDSGAPTVPAREYKMEVLELDISSSGSMSCTMLSGGDADSDRRFEHTAAC
jgi:hypothetical protein